MEKFRYIILMPARVVCPPSLSLILLGIVLLTVPFHLRPENFIVDDGYFYPQIARNIVHGQGSTFNGIMLTNGYHPLWMIVCVLAAAVTSASTPLLQILGTVQDLLLLASVAILILIARTAKLQGTTLGYIPLIFFGTVLGIWSRLSSMALQNTLRTRRLTTSSLPTSSQVRLRIDLTFRKSVEVARRL